ncbi:hypothetical protein R3W88_016462 [Solanum pinnatisectum]|uniref:Uncharacterized protein n=1 Tax=Solanum pinnatisectum TaxID=50273 RepID=A0AAV9KXV6_9SOLN|nr:hypothetical protein R3W88_016462 [Solanum pinnatisectum]
MVNVLILTPRVDQYIVNERNHKHIKVLSKHYIHQFHKSSWSISQTKRHHQKLIMTIPSLESHFWNVIFFHPQLVATRPKINLGEVTHSLKLVQQIIYPWKRILILNGHHVQLAIVNVHAKRTILLSNKQNWSTP